MVLTDHGRRFLVKGLGLPSLLVTANSSADTSEINNQVSSMLTNMIPASEANTNITGWNSDFNDGTDNGIEKSQQMFSETLVNSSARCSTPIEDSMSTMNDTNIMRSQVSVNGTFESRQIDYFQRVYGFKLTNEIMKGL